MKKNSKSSKIRCNETVIVCKQNGISGQMNSNKKGIFKIWVEKVSETVFLYFVVGFRIK